MLKNVIQTEVWKVKGKIQKLLADYMKGCEEKDFKKDTNEINLIIPFKLDF